MHSRARSSRAAIGCGQSTCNCHSFVAYIRLTRFTTNDAEPSPDLDLAKVLATLMKTPDKFPGHIKDSECDVGAGSSKLASLRKRYASWSIDYCTPSHRAPLKTRASNADLNICQRQKLNRQRSTRPGKQRSGDNARSAAVRWRVNWTSERNPTLI